MKASQYSSRRVYTVSESTGTVGSGILGERTISAPCASRIVVSGPFQVELRVDESMQDDVMLRFRADDNVLPRVRARLRDGALEIALEDGMYSDLSELKVSARVGRIGELSASGRASVTVHGLCGESVLLQAAHASVIHAGGAARNLQLSAAGQSLVRLHVSEVRRLVLGACDASTVQLEGACDALSLSASGAARVFAGRPAFQAREAQLDVSGATRVSLCVRERVTGRVRFPARATLACRGEIDLLGQYGVEPLS